MGPPEIEPRSLYHLIRSPAFWNMTVFPSNRWENPRPMTQHCISHEGKSHKQGYKNLTFHKSLHYFILLSHWVFIKPKNTAACDLLINWKKILIFLQHGRQVQEVSDARKMQISSSPFELHNSFPTVLTSPNGHNTAGVMPKT